jgi:hypothetical protein
VQERERERRNCSLPPDYDTDVPGMPDLIPTNKSKGSQEHQANVVFFIECRDGATFQDDTEILMKLRLTHCIAIV